VGEQLLPEALDRIPVTAPLFDLFLGPIRLRISHRVPTVAIGESFEEVGAIPGPAMLECSLRRLVDREDILAIDSLGGDVVGAGLPVHLPHG
jgi:hypothetical protein